MRNQRVNITHEMIEDWKDFISNPMSLFFKPISKGPDRNQFKLFLLIGLP